jgi:glutaredoxin-related protein
MVGVLREPSQPSKHEPTSRDDTQKFLWGSGKRMGNRSRLLLDALIQRGVLSEKEIRQLETEVEEKLKPKNILTERELREVVRRLRNLTFPPAKSWAEHGFIGGLKQTAEDFSAERTYGAVELRNLKTAILRAGVRKLEVFEKLESAAQLGRIRTRIIKSGFHVTYLSSQWHEFANAIVCAYESEG